MLTILHPEVLPLVCDVPVGLIALSIPGKSRPVLVVKASKEVMLAAKLNLGFKVYVVPVTLRSGQTAGIISAFFDDDDEPLALSTPMFEDYGTRELRRALLSGALDVHFFDEQSREMMGYVAEVLIAPTTRALLSDTKLLAFSNEELGSYWDQMTAWFGVRTTADDSAAMSITLGGTLFPDDLLHIDARPENNAYHGCRGVDHSTLVRENPGPFQERDIALMLGRVFPQAAIYLGPLRVNDRKEIADIIVITQLYALFIQAKDSPNTEHVLRNTIARKKATALKSLQKAEAQISGAIRYANASNSMQMLVGSTTVEVSLSSLRQRALIVVKELFNDEYPAYSEILLANANRTAVPCIALDFSELNQYTLNLADEKSFFQAYERVYEHGKGTGMFPRLRFTMPGG
jgi:hypothetical protein